MSTWYKVWFGEIETVEVEKATKNFLVVMEDELVIRNFGKTTKTKKVARRYPKEATGMRFFPTWAEAHAHLIKVLEEDLLTAKLALNDAEVALELAKHLEEPHGP